MSHLCCSVQNEIYGQVPRNIFDSPSQWVTQNATLNLKREIITLVTCIDATSDIKSEIITPTVYFVFTVESQENMKVIYCPLGQSDCCRNGFR